jgi:hypothetical protein
LSARLVRLTCRHSSSAARSNAPTLLAERQDVIEEIYETSDLAVAA